MGGIIGGLEKIPVVHGKIRPGFFIIISGWVNILTPTHQKSNYLFYTRPSFLIFDIKRKFHKNWIEYFWGTVLILRRVICLKVQLILLTIIISNALYFCRIFKYSTGTFCLFRGFESFSVLSHIGIWLFDISLVVIFVISRFSLSVIGVLWRPRSRRSSGQVG